MISTIGVAFNIAIYIEEMIKFIHEQSVELQEYDEQLVRRLIEKITVFDEKPTVEFKSGVEFDVKI